jgi:hypothetical protein
MKYALLIYAPENGAVESLPDDERQKLHAEYMALAERPSAVGGAQLQPGATATTVRVDGGQTLTTDGPYAETKEILGGFYLIDVEDIDSALEFASKVPAARLGGSVEVRPLVER